MIPTSNAADQVSGAVISLKLLDAVQGHDVQTWNFDSQHVVQIGRLEENDVVVTDPFVSRLHATLKCVDGVWELIALGKHGVLIDDRRVESTTLKHNMVFRLGAKGPELKFIELDRAPPKESQSHRSTIDIDAHMIETLRIDQERALEQVNEIASNDGFELLRQKARELREKRSAQGP